MNILHINSYYSTSRFYKSFYDSQINQGLDITVFVPVSNKNDFSDQDYGSYTIFSKSYHDIHRLFYHIKQFKIFKDVDSKIDVKSFSIIHAHSLFTNGFVAHQLFKKYKIPYIVAIRNTDINIFFKNMIHLRKIGIEIMNDASKLIFISEPYRNEVFKKFVPKQYKVSFLDKSVIIPNGIDTFWLDNIGKEKSIQNPSDLNLIQVGDINKNKNILQTVQVIEELIKDGYKVKLDVIGSVRNKSIYNHIISKDFVNYHGFVPKEELINYYRKNDLFILLSIHETFGIVYLEAMSQGLPLIYTRNQGFDKLFEEGEVGYSVDPNNVSEVIHRIKDIIDNYHDLSKRCLDNVSDFDWKKINELYLQVYKECS